MTSTGGDLLGRCQADVTPDVGYNDTTTVSCTITNVSVTFNAAIVTASVDNPGRG
jgi:predicted secreted Zn-dependent protease